MLLHRTRTGARNNSTTQTPGRLQVLQAVPVFRPQDLCCRAFTTGTAHCALGWVKELGIRRTGTLPTYDDVLRAYVTCARKLFGTHVYYAGVMRINDQYCRNNVQRAQLLNATFARLGYTTNQPRSALRLAQRAR